jgi:hypothetical protein
MYEAQPNTTKNSPEKMLYLVRDLDTDLIICYRGEKEPAEKEAGRLNRHFFPDSTPSSPVSAASPDNGVHENGETLSLF